MSYYPWFKHYDPGVPRTIGVYPEGTLLDAVDAGIRQRPDATAFLFKGRAMSLRELGEASDAFAVALAAMGVKRGDRVACILPNCPQFFIGELAAWKLGAVWVPLNPIYTDEELVGPLITTGATVMLTLSAFYERVKSVQPRTSVRRVVLTNIKEWFPRLLRLIFTLAVERKSGHRATARDADVWLPALLKRHAGERPAAARPGKDDDALLLMSGGTTGTPKAVRVHHGGLVQTGTQVRAWLAAVLPPWDGVYCLPLPMFHSYGACGVQTSCLLGHNPIALVPNPRDFDDLVKTIEVTKPAVFCGVPSLYNALLNHRKVIAGKVDFRSMRACVSGAAPLMVETIRRFEATTGARIIEGYALTESVLAATINPLKGPEKPGSVGLPLPDCVVRIVDADNPTRELPTGEVGEILLTGPQIMRGYWGAPDDTEEMLQTHADGTKWLHTADLGYLDADGYLYIVDRKKDLIKMGGMQVWPREIEEVLSAHPAVLECGVRGFPDERRGEVAVAFVVRRVGQAATEEELRAWCKEKLAPFKVPARIVFRPELPKSMIGKVLRRFLTEDAQAAT
ncbi:MAG: AMP-binding protein [Gemmatimonadaceae bacterium]